MVKTACLFHDSGMLKTYIGHEEASCELVSETLPKFGYLPEAIASINKMIMTTKLPQSAESQLEKIICDADLDYLGRDDFYMISHRLKYEWDIYNIRKTSLKEWYRLQIDFLKNHRFFTRSAITSREQRKQQNLMEIFEMLNGV
ncbi:MAG: phosphohydrolase [Candidatus Moranbacteria bacterium]|nr:phosphohydrolase [Candidatus Moranbacteria bacterium]